MVILKYVAESGEEDSLPISRRLSSDCIEKIKTALREEGCIILSCEEGSIIITCDIDLGMVSSFKRRLENGKLDGFHPILAKLITFIEGEEVTAQTIKRFAIASKDYTPICNYNNNYNNESKDHTHLEDPCIKKRFEEGNLGLDKAYDEAISILPELTHDPAECVIYVTRFYYPEKNDWFVYAHSNLRSKADPNYATKLVMRRPSPLAEVAKLMLYGGRSITSDEEITVANIHKNVFRYVVNRRLMTNGLIGEIEFNGAQRWIIGNPAKW
jgi:hypothetical protein